MPIPDHPTLAGIRCCPRCGHTPLTFPDNHKSILCPACGFELFFNPAAAAAVLILSPEQELLLVRRQKNPGKGKLGLPGGFADPFETVEQAVLREVQEEIGVQLPENGLHYFCSMHNLYRYHDVDYTSLDSYFYWIGKIGPLRLQKEEVTEVVRRPVLEITPEEIAFPAQWYAIQRYQTILNNMK